jgi:hypothetical protein
MPKLNGWARAPRARAARAWQWHPQYKHNRIGPPGPGREPTGNSDHDSESDSHIGWQAQRHPGLGPGLASDSDFKLPPTDSEPGGAGRIGPLRLTARNSERPGVTAGPAPLKT